MVRFIKILQLLILILVGGYVLYDVILHGVSIFDNYYVIISLVLGALLELSLFIIKKLIEDD